VLAVVVVPAVVLLAAVVPLAVVLAAGLVAADAAVPLVDAVVAAGAVVAAAGAVVAAAAPVVAAGFVAAGVLVAVLVPPQAASSIGTIIVSSANEVARAHDFLPRFNTVAIVRFLLIVPISVESTPRHARGFVTTRW
jgi:hypothetical protein